MTHPILFRVVPIALALCACASDTPERSASAPPLAGEGGEYSTSPVFAIGAVEGPEDQLLGRVYAAFVRGNSVFIANGIVPEIREYDFQGRLIRRIGRRGGGPGEFRNLRWIAPLSGDSLLALDLFGSRVTVFSGDGSYGRSFQLDVPQHGQAEWVSEFGAGFAVGFSHGLDPRRMSGPAQDSFSVVFLDRSGARRLGRGLPLIGGRWWVRTSRGGISAIEEGASPLLAVRDSLVIATTGDLQAVLRLSGTAWERVPLIGQEWDNGLVEGTDIPMRLYEQLVAGPGGEFWLSDFTISEAGGRTWRIFDQSGRLRTTLSLPARFRVFQIERDYVLGKTTDEDGVEYVELLRLNRSGTSPDH